MGLVEENYRDSLLGTLFLALVTGLAPWGTGADGLFLQWCEIPPLPLVSGFGSIVGLDSPPERFRWGEVLVALCCVTVNVGQFGVQVLIIKGLEVPVLEKGTLGTG